MGTISDPNQDLTEGADATFGVTTVDTVEPTADGSSGDNATVGYNATDGLTLRGQGSTGDVTILNDANAIVGHVPTGTQNWNYHGNVVVGNSSLTGDSTLHVYTASAGAVTASPGADDIVVEGAGTTGVSILAKDASDCNFVMGTTSDEVGALIQWDYSGDVFKVGSKKAAASLVLNSGDGTTALTIDSSQNVDIDSGELQMAGTTVFDSSRNLYRTVTDSITAGSTQTQAGATALTTDFNRVTSGSANDGVKLPSAAAGLEVTIRNDAGAALQVWPNSSDKIDDGSADAVDGNTLADNTTRKYIAIDATDWYTSTNS